MILLFKRFSSSPAKYRLEQFQQFKAFRGADESIEGLSNSGAHLLGWALETKYKNDLMLTSRIISDGGYSYDGLLFQDNGFVERRMAEIESDPLGLLHPDRVHSDITELLEGSYGAAYFTTPEHLKDIAKLMTTLANTKAAFEYINVSKREAEMIFIGSPFKLSMIASMQEPITVVRCGDYLDMSKGPFMANVRQIRVIEVDKTSGSQWTSSLPPNLTRVSGLAFKSVVEQKEYRAMKIEANRRDHRKIGKKQGLFTFHPYALGSPFFLPHGTRIVQKLKDYLRDEYKHFGFQEVITPLLYNKALWQTSGHWENYKEDMFTVDQIDHDLQGNPDQIGIKPMNCPGHCLLFSDTGKSYRDLPLRYAEFSPLHRYSPSYFRNEYSGALTGLTRVRKFHQDDGHIFCTKSQVKQEISSSLEFVERAYTKLGFKEYKLALSTRPSKYIGKIEEWDQAEQDLKEALNQTGKEWTTKDEDGAFYGPKIDIMVKDALGRFHQTATIQLDFQLPKRFQLQYNNDKDGTDQPVMIHRAILGSIERMLGILIESCAGKWPFWISPRQAIIISTRTALHPVAQEFKRALTLNNDYFIDVDISDNTLSKQIREAIELGYNYILVVGDREAQDGTLSVRSRDGTTLGEFKPDELLEFFSERNKDV